jgi:vacuolar-type H+-ATPase subunit H
VDRFNFGSFAGDASQRVQSIVSTAEAEAAGLLRDAEREVDLIRREAQAEADRIVEDARRRADELVEERLQLLSQLTDGIVERTEMLFERVDSTGHVRRQFDELLRSLGEAAENLGRESGTRRAAPRPTSHVPRSTHVPPVSTHVPPPAPPAPRPPVTHTARPASASVRPAAPPPPPPPAPPRRDPVPPRPEPVQETRRVDDHNDARFDGARLVALQMAVAGSTREEVHAELQRAFRLPDPSSILDDVFGGPRRSGIAG